MTNPTDRRYTKSHEWVKVDGNEATIGITDHAQSELTDIVFVDLPKVGRVVAGGESVLVLESVKTVADVYAPGGGTISAANAELKAHPELMNQDPFGKGWVFRITLTHPLDPSASMDASQYETFVSSSSGSH
ncbi:MAG: glycine cleavage system protein GcvH [Thermoplasmata archaeon]|nr:glycine cleavage system protein GcvH [Thermoplasmata archaeon]